MGGAGGSMDGVDRLGKTTSAAAREADAVRTRRLREDARRPMKVNLAEGIALSHMLMRFTGAARKT